MDLHRCCRAHAPEGLDALDGLAFDKGDEARSKVRISILLVCREWKETGNMAPVTYPQTGSFRSCSVAAAVPHFLHRGATSEADPAFAESDIQNGGLCFKPGLLCCPNYYLMVFSTTAISLCPRLAVLLRSETGLICLLSHKSPQQK